MAFTLTRYENNKRIRESFKTKAAAKRRVIDLNAWADIVDVPDDCLERIEIRRDGEMIYQQGRKP